MTLTWDRLANPKEHHQRAQGQGIEFWYAALTETALRTARRVPSWREGEQREAFTTVALAVAAFETGTGGTRDHVD